MVGWCGGWPVGCRILLSAPVPFLWTLDFDCQEKVNGPIKQDLLQLITIGTGIFQFGQLTSTTSALAPKVIISGIH